MSITDKSAEAGFLCGEMSKMTDFPCTCPKNLVSLHAILRAMHRIYAKQTTMTESNRIEFKRELTRELDIEKEVVAFLPKAALPVL